ncbi:hypothetical protein O0L34_g4140 [Tuta absoluta]|nr:hypothetical protein O0L34_g4140 [Tuta absoluta]
MSPAKKCCCPFEEAHPNMCCTKQQRNRKKPPRRLIYNDKCYLMSLGNTLQSCRCSQPPLCYPDLPTSHLCKLLAHSLLYLLAALIWSPFLLFFIICFSCCCSNHCC